MSAVIEQMQMRLDTMRRQRDAERKRAISAEKKSSVLEEQLKVRNELFTAHPVSTAMIKNQEELGWPDMHPEEYCHRCGARNMLWCAEREDWVQATTAWAKATGREGICCPKCFASMHEDQTGHQVIWVLVQSTKYQWLIKAAEGAHEVGS